MNLKKCNSYNKYDKKSTNNKSYKKSISLTSLMTSSNTNGSKQNGHFNLNNTRNLSNSNWKKNNLYINNILNTYNTNKGTKSFYINSFSKFRRNNNKDLISNKFGKTIFRNKNHILTNNFIRRSKSKSILNPLFTGKNDDKDTVNILLNHYPNIEKHKKKNFNQEIKYFVNSLHKELNAQNKKVMYSYNKKNIMTPYKIISHSNPLLIDENVYKFNVVANSKLLSINDIQENNIKNFFILEKQNSYKRSLSLKNLETIINNKSPKYISDTYSNDNIKRKSIKIFNYKSEKLREIYDELDS